MTTYVYGASDDLIELEGDLYEEFGLPDSDPYYLAFSDGTLLKIGYDGEWNIKLIEGRAKIMSAGQAYADFDPDTPEYIQNNVPNYSDLAVLEGDLTWVVGGTDVVR